MTSIMVVETLLAWIPKFAVDWPAGIVIELGILAAEEVADKETIAPPL